MKSGKSTLSIILLVFLSFNLLFSQSKPDNSKQKGVLVDLIPPVAVCDGYEQVSLTNIPTKVFALTFDDGSWDDVCMDKFYFVVKRMGEDDSKFKPYIDFYCDDVANSPIKVVLRVFDCAGNYNDCWSFANVEDKTKPVLVCPNDLTVDCLEDISKYWGKPNTFDNCGNVSLSFKINDATDQCQQGYVTKVWTGKDQFNNQSTCSQRIYKKHVSDYSVTFPPDTVITECLSPADLNNTGVPVFMDKDCELVAIEHIDHDLPITNGDGCFVRIRKWKLISWCNYDPFAPTHTNLGIPLGGKKYKDDDGYFEYIQYIKVFESSKPVINCKDTVVCVSGTDCTADFNIPKPGVLDCSPQITYSLSGDLGSKFQVTKVPIGVYTIDHNISDGCGNHSFCTTKVTVKDCKKPTPVVINGLSTTLMVQTGQVAVWASDFNQSSYDNCTPADKLVFSFSPDTTDKFKIFDCDSLGIRTVKIYATDQYGNVDFAVTTIDIQDNMNACDSTSTIVQLSGNVKKANGSVLSNVHLDNDLLKLTSDNEGNFTCPAMKILMPAQLTISKLGTANEDVSILDLILVKNHILGTKKFTSPYQFLAADVNMSKSISTADIWQMQQIILGSQKEWKNNTSWNFIDKSKVFEPAISILNDEVSQYTLNESMPDSIKLEFVGIKTGDISSETSQFGKLQFRNALSLDIIESSDTRKLIYSSQEELQGIQFSLSLDNSNIHDLKFDIPADQYFIQQLDNKTIISFLINEPVIPGQTFCSWRKNQAADYIELSHNLEAIGVDNDFQLHAIEFQNKLSETNYIISDCYPDPAKSIVNLSLQSPHSEIIQISISDIQGRVIETLEKDIIKGKNQVQFNLHLSNGTYFMNFTVDGKKIVRKFNIVN